MGLYYDFGYKKELKAKDYDKLTFEEYKQFINELNFDNYCVTEMKDEGKK